MAKHYYDHRSPDGHCLSIFVQRSTKIINESEASNQHQQFLFIFNFNIRYAMSDNLITCIHYVDKMTLRQ